MFEIGDRVRVRVKRAAGAYHARLGMTGTVRCSPLNGSGLFAIEMDDPCGKGEHWHSCSGRIPSCMGYWIYGADLELDVPMSPFETKVRAYISRELPNG